MTNGLPPGGTTPVHDPRQSDPVVAPRLSDPWIGRTLKNRYAIAGKLGQGGMGIVYLAEDITLKRVVAIKRIAQTLTGESRGLQRFLREAQSAARLQHANVVAIYDIDAVDDDHFFVMEFVPGPTAAQIIQRDGALSWQAATTIIIEACRALVAAHQSKLVHRDVKPANILVSRTGEVKLGDFGLAKTVSEEQSAITHSNHAVGTPQFMSPEQVKNEDVDERTDIYSLGATYYTLLTGEPPFQANGWYATMYAHTTQPVPDPRVKKPAVSEACAKIISRAMAKRRSDRFGSAQEMLTALQTALGSASVDLSSIAGKFDMPELSLSLGPALAKRGAWRLPLPWPWLAGLAGALILVGSLSMGCLGFITYRMFFAGGPAPVVARPAEDDVEKLRRELLKLSPGWDGKFAELQIQNKRIVKLSLVIDHIRDIGPLGDLLDLEELSLSATQGMELKTTLKDISVLRKLTKVQHLLLSGILTDNIDALSAMKSLRSLHMFDSHVKNLAALDGLPIVKIRIAATYVENLKGLEKAPLEIGNFDFSYRLDSLEGLPLAKLKYLSFNSALVDSLTPVKDAMNLEHLDFTSAKLTEKQRKVMPRRSLRPDDMRIVMDLPGLEKLNGEFTPSELKMLRAHFRARNQTIEITSTNKVDKE